MARAANVRDVARAAGVSPASVSNTLNRPARVSAETRERVLAAIAELGYRPNEAARQLRIGHSNAIGVIVRDVRNPYFSDIVLGAEHAAEAHGYVTVIGNTEGDSAREHNYLDLFEAQQVRGVLVYAHGGQQEREHLERLRSRGVASVLLDGDPTNGDFCSVLIDDSLGGYQAGRHLTEVGCRRIMFVGGPPDARQFQQRLAGAQRGVSTVDNACLDIVEVADPTAERGVAVGESIVARDVAERPDGILTSNDLLAIGIVQSLSLGRVRVPRDIAIVGYDDIAFATSAPVPLSSIRQPIEVIGQTALRLLLSELDERKTHAHEHVVLQPQLIARMSTTGHKQGTSGSRLQAPARAPRRPRVHPS